MSQTPRQRPREIGRRTFGIDDQAWFAALSGDHNPMHVDPVAARRLLTGVAVVHGIHVLLAALEQWEHDPRSAPLSIECSFNNAVNVGDEVVFEQRGDGRHDVIEASVAGLCCARIRVESGTGALRPAAPPAAVSSAGRHAARLETALDLPAAQQVGQRHRLELAPDEALPTHFARSCDLLGTARVEGLLALSYFVGMVCPGLHSIFSTLRLRFDGPPDDAGAVTLLVERFDDRFRRFEVSIGGALAGTLTAFLRPPPQHQPTMDEIAREVGADEFKGTRSLVVGASRGLGELIAKVLAAGGGDVVVSYSRGRDDARRVAAEIDAAGRGRCDTVQIDVTTGDYGAVDLARLDAVYFFATPRIYRRKAGAFVAALFQEFVDFYVTGLHALCERIEALPLDRKLRVYVPSSVFVAERPEGLAEYAMAKAAVEVLAAELNRTSRRVRILVTRLPRLSTDQTTSLLRIATEDNLATVLPVVRAMNE